MMCLQKDLGRHYVPGTFFQQDNAPIHVAKQTKEWLEARGIWVLDWPAHSPDLNPIEHVWKKMKDILYRDFPHLCKMTGSLENIEEFKAALKVAWGRVPQAFIDGLIDSVPRRVAAVQAAGGWYTKY